MTGSRIEAGRVPALFLALLAVAVAGVVVLGTLARQEGVPRQRTIWAEDGLHFADCALRREPADCLFRPYAGYLQVASRIGAVVAPLGPLSKLPLRLILSAALIAAAAAVIAALTVHRLAPGTFGGTAAALLAGSSFVLVWPAGMEVAGNLTNLHWIVFAASVVVLAGQVLGVRPGVPAIALVGLAMLTSALAPLLLPPLALVAALRRRERARAMLLVVVAGALVHGAVILTSVRRQTPGDRPPELLLEGIGGLLRGGWFGPARPELNLVVPLVLALVIAVLILRRLHAEAAIVAIVAAVGALVSSVAIVQNGAVGVRYLYVPAVLWICAIAVGIAAICARPAPRRAQLMAGLLVVALIPGFVTSFRLVTISSSGPDVGAQVRATGCEASAPGSVVVLLLAPYVAPPGLRWRAPCT